MRLYRSTLVLRLNICFDKNINIDRTIFLIIFQNKSFYQVLGADILEKSKRVNSKKLKYHRAKVLLNAEHFVRKISVYHLKRILVQKIQTISSLLSQFIKMCLVKKTFFSFTYIFLKITKNINKIKFR